MALIPNAPFQVDTIPEDMKVLRTALRETLRDIPGAPVKSGERRILNLACGRADETRGPGGDIWSGSDAARNCGGRHP